ADVGVRCGGASDLVDGGFEWLFGLAGVRVDIDLDAGDPTLAKGGKFHCYEHVEYRFVQPVLDRYRRCKLGQTMTAYIGVVSEVEDGNCAEGIWDDGLRTAKCGLRNSCV